MAELGIRISRIRLARSTGIAMCPAPIMVRFAIHGLTSSASECSARGTTATTATIESTARDAVARGALGAFCLNATFKIYCDLPTARSAASTSSILRLELCKQKLRTFFALSFTF